MSKWLTHVKATMKTMKGEKKALGKKWFSHVLKTAKKSYHKHKGGEESSSDDEKAERGGRRHRKRGGRTRRHHK